MGLLTALRRRFKRPPPVPVEVHREARREMALLLRRLVSGQMDNFAFDDAAEELMCAHWEDPALDAVYWWCWGLYDDLRRHRVRDLPAELRREAARIVLFLRSDLAYCWVPGEARRGRVAWRSTLADVIAWLGVGIKIPVFGMLMMVFRVWMWYVPGLKAPRAGVEEEREAAWPFADVGQLDLARGTPQLLAG